MGSAGLSKIFLYVVWLNSSLILHEIFYVYILGSSAERSSSMEYGAYSAALIPLAGTRRKESVCLEFIGTQPTDLDFLLLQPIAKK
jgi:hypothetical protein